MLDLPLKRAGAPPTLVFLYGPPAVGKLTVARALARRLPFKVLHNHATIDPILPFFEYGSRPFWEVAGRLRTHIVDVAAQEGVDLVYTRYDLTTPISGRASLTFDTSQLSADTVADRIIAHLDSLTTPATV